MDLKTGKALRDGHELDRRVHGEALSDLNGQRVDMIT